MVFIVKDQPHRVTCFFTRRKPPLGRTHVLPSSPMAVQAPRLEWESVSRLVKESSFLSWQPLRRSPAKS